MKLTLRNGKKPLVIDCEDKKVIADGLRFFIGGESGSGKSNAAMLVAAQWVEQGGQMLVLDAHGEYGGLWEARPNSVIRIGYGEAPVREESVELCMSYLREGHTLVLDLSHWTDLHPDKLDKFVRDLLKDLYELRRHKAKRTLVLVEEAQNFAPQMQMSGQSANIRLFTALITGGRKFGLNFILSTQRQGLVDSNVIAGCNVRLFMRISEAKDWKKMKEYIPPRFPVGFGGAKKFDIRNFESGEALALSRWFDSQRVRLDLPSVPVRKFL